MLKINLISKTLLFLALLFVNSQAHAQENSEQKKLERIVKLSWFIDWSQNKSFKSEEKIIYIVTDEKAAKNFQNAAIKNDIFSEWKIICTNKIIDITEGSVVFITKSKEQLDKWIINLSEKKDILTIAENSDNFCNNGGMINIINISGQIKFEVNYRIIQNKSIDISSKLLALSKIYE